MRTPRRRCSRFSGRGCADDRSPGHRARRARGAPGEHPQNSDEQNRDDGGLDGIAEGPTTLDRGRRPPRLPTGRWLSPLDPVSAPSGRPPHQPRRNPHHAHSATGPRPLARRQRHPIPPQCRVEQYRGGRGPGGTTNRLHQQGQVISRGAYLLCIRFDHDNQLISTWPHLVRDLDTRDGD
jgi:hypothetical protein